MSIKSNFRKRFIFLFLAAVLMPVSAAETVRVGFSYDGDFMYKDKNGRYCGYEVEYLYHVAQIAGWTVKFEDIDNLDALDNGSIDILCGMVKTSEREHKYLFSDKRMGATYCTLMVRSDNFKYIYDDYSTFSGMKTGVEKHSFLSSAYSSWCRNCRLVPDVCEFESLEEAFGALAAGQIDAVAAGGEYSVSGTRRIAEFDPVDFYFAVRADKENLKKNIDDAMMKLLLKDPMFELKLHNKYFGQTVQSEPLFSQLEKTFIHKHDSIKVALLENDLPYAYRKKDGTADGILIEYFRKISAVSGLSFRFVFFNNMNAAREAVRQGRIDAVGMYGDDIIEAGSQMLSLSESYMQMNDVRIMRKGTDKIMHAGIDEREGEYLLDRLSSDTGTTYYIYRNTYDGFRDLNKRRIEALITDLPAATWILDNSRSTDYVITSMPSCSWNACIALREGDSVLLGILDKSILSSSAVMNELVTRNSIQEISGIGAFVNRIPAMWAFTAVFVLLAMTVLLVFAVITIVQRHKQETALAKKEAETDQKETELAATARANEEKDRFFSTISHDMRTPLNGIIGFAGLAEKSEDIKQVKDYLAKIRISGNLLLDLVNDTLTLSRINNGKIIMHLEPIDNYELMDYIAVPIRQAAEKDGVDFTIDTSKARKRKILADRLSIQKIFLNLLSNAVKFTPKNGHVLFAIETIPYDSHDAQTVFIVKDDGIGMSSSFIPRMFDPFSQEQRNPQDARGSGLGLSIVKQLVTCMGGTIDVQSEINKGTCFTVSLHFQEAPDDTESAISLPIYTYNKDFLSGKKILLCEDNELNVEIARALLETEKMTVVCAKNGSEGVKIFEASGVREFDAVLMDLRMPVMDGYQSASGIRALAREDAATVPIIAMTADTLEDDVAMCREAGMNGHVSKPINPDMLYSKLAELCS